MKNYIIREITPEDAEKVIDYINQIGKESDNLSFGAEGLQVSIENERAFIQSVLNHPRNVFFGVWLDGTLVGDGSLTVFSRRFAHRADLGISVRKSEWHQGVGSLIMKTLIEHAKTHQIELINLEVRSDNINAIHLYEKYGFKRYGISPAFFKIDNEYFDCDLMVLDLR